MSKYTETNSSALGMNPEYIRMIEHDRMDQYSQDVTRRSSLCDKTTYDASNINSDTITFNQIILVSYKHVRITSTHYRSSVITSINDIMCTLKS